MGAQVAAAVSLWAASSSLQVGRSSCRSVLECRRHRSAAPRAVSLTTPLSSASTSSLLISLSLPCPLLLPGPPHVAVLDNLILHVWPQKAKSKSHIRQTENHPKSTKF